MRRRRVLLLAVASVAFVACRDYLMAPPAHQDPLTLRPGQHASATVYPNESPASATVPLVIDGLSGGGTTDPSFVAPWYRHATVVKATVSGLVVRTPNFAGLGSATSYGPIGNTAVTWHDGNNVFSVASFTSTDAMYLLLTANSHLDGGASNSYGVENEQNYLPPGQTDRITCGPQYQASPCATFSGSYSFMLTRLESSLSLVADSTNVGPGSTVHFYAEASPSVVEGQSMPVEVDSSTWIPDPASQGGEPSDTTSPCFFGLRGNACTRVIIGSGTLSVVAYVNGKRQTGSVHVTTPTLTLTAAPAYIHRNANVTFTPTWSDGHATVPDMWSWAWTADVPPGHTSCNFWEDPCTKAVQETGTMKVQVKRNGVFRYATARAVAYSSFTLVVDKPNVALGDSVTFSPTYDGTLGSAARWRWVPGDTATNDVGCADGTGPCRKQMIVSGRMWAYSSAGNGSGDSAYADVAVVLPTLSVTVDKSEVGEGVAATFTGTLSPSPAIAPSAEWTWLSDQQIVANRRPTVGSGVGTRSIHAPAPRSLKDQAPHDTLLEAANDSAFTGAPAEMDQTTACTLNSLTCSASIHGSGQMRLDVHILGRLLTGSASVGVRYYCPEVIPDVDGVGVHDPIIIERSTETWIRSGLPNGSGTISFWGPYSRLQVTREGVKGNFEKARYRVGRGQDWNGWIVVPMPIPGGPRQLEGSWVELECRAWLRDDGTTTGSVWPTGRHNANLKPPAP